MQSESRHDRRSSRLLRVDTAFAISERVSPISLSSRSLIAESAAIAACSMRQVMWATNQRSKVVSSFLGHDNPVMPCGAAGTLSVVLIVISVMVMSLIPDRICGMAGVSGS
jgi:hypothetical protein